MPNFWFGAAAGGGYVCLCACNPTTVASRWLNYERDLAKAVEKFRAGGGDGGVRYGYITRLVFCRSLLCSTPVVPPCQTLSGSVAVLMLAVCSDASAEDPSGSVRSFLPRLMASRSPPTL